MKCPSMKPLEWTRKNVKKNSRPVISEKIFFPKSPPIRIRIKVQKAMMAVSVQ